MQEDLDHSWSVRPIVSHGLMWTFGALVGIGVATFLVSLRLDPLRAWQTYLVNFLFWEGMAQGAVVFAAIYHVVGGKWGPTVRRLGEGAVAYLPVGFILFVPLYAALEIFFRRVREINPNRGAWFDPRFIFVRGGLGIALITVLSFFFVYYSLRFEVGTAQERNLKPMNWLHRWIAGGWQKEDVEILRCQRGVDFLAAGVLLAYPFVYTFMAFDMIMALDPFWYSSLFGGYFFISSFYLGLAGLAIVTVLLHRNLGHTIIPASQLADLGKLILGFDLTYLAMVWAQYIVIWYGNLPEETHFIILRVWKSPWAPLSWSVFVMSVLIPFLIFLSRRAKEISGYIVLVGGFISAGLWLERYVLVVPSLWVREGLPFGWVEIGVTCGFLGAAGLAYLFFLKNFSVLPYNKVLLSYSTPGETNAGATASRI